MASEISGPAGLRVEPTEFEMLTNRRNGFQPISATFLIAWAANFGIVMTWQYSIRNGLSLIAVSPNTLSARVYTIGQRFKDVR